MNKRFSNKVIIVAIGMFAFQVLTLSVETRADNRPSQTTPTPFPNDEGAKNIFKRNEIQDEARRLEKQGLYEAAIAKYREATDPILLNYDYEAGVAIGGITRIYQKQGQFELALKELQWHLQKNPDKYLDRKLELEALIKARRTNSPQPIYEHIKYLKKKYKKQLPPHHGFPWEAVVEAIIRLYDHIADSDGGIEFTEAFLKHYKKIGPGNPYQSGNPYYQIKQAFLEDKKNGFKGCLEVKPGEVCMGRATKALIQSDYFSW